MPVYVYCCGDHGAFEVVVPMARRDRVQKCPECGRKSPRIFAAPSRGIHTRYPYMDDDLAAAPVRIESPGHLKREMRKRGIYDRWDGI